MNRQAIFLPGLSGSGQTTVLSFSFINLKYERRYYSRFDTNSDIAIHPNSYGNPIPWQKIFKTETAVRNKKIHSAAHRYVTQKITLRRRERFGTLDKPAQFKS